jgi:hypothetical protein
MAYSFALVSFGLNAKSLSLLESIDKKNQGSSNDMLSSQINASISFRTPPFRLNKNLIQKVTSKLPSNVAS